LTEQLETMLKIIVQEKSHCIKSNSSDCDFTTAFDRTTMLAASPSVIINNEFTLPTSDEIIKLNDFFQSDYVKIITEDNDNYSEETTTGLQDVDLYTDCSEEIRLKLTSIDQSIIEVRVVLRILFI